MKFLREGKSKSIYDDFFHDTISELENIRPKVSQVLIIRLYPHYQSNRRQQKVSV